MENGQLTLLTKGTVKTSEGREFTRLLGGFGEDKPIITTKQISELIGYDNSIVTRTINRNIKHFQEGVDIIDLKGAMPEWQSEIGYTKNAFNASKNIYGLSEAGFLLYLKFADGDKSVELYKEFIEDYFRVVAENKVMEKTLAEELEFLKQQKKFILGSMFMEEDESKKMDFFNQSEKLNNRITEIKITLSKEQIIEQLKPQLTIADKFTNTDNLYDVGIFSKILNIKDLGRNNFFEWLRSKKMLMSNNIPYQNYMDYFKVIATENKYNNHINNKTLIKPKGVEYIIKKLIEDGRVITKSIDDIMKELEPTAQKAS
jgi:phage antirepressor YoqD-like protein